MLLSLNINKYKYINKSKDKFTLYYTDFIIYFENNYFKDV